MKSYFIYSFLIISFAAHSQPGVSYISFLKTDTAIQWAGESDKILDLKGREGKYNIKAMYLAFMQGNRAIKAYYFDSIQKTFTPYQFKNPDMDLQPFAKGLDVERLAHNFPREWVFVDPSKEKDDYTRYRYKADDKTFTSDSCCGCDNINAFRVKQILYYKDQRFHIYNPYMTMLCARKTQSTLLAWYPLCNVAYNPSNHLPDSVTVLQLLNIDVAEYDFMQHKAPGTDGSLYQSDIYQIIREDLKRGKLKAFDYETNVLIPPGELYSWNAPVDTVFIQDKDGRYSQKTVVRLTKLSDLCRFRITQKLYFDIANEKLYSVIESVVLMKAIYTHSGTLIGYKPFAKLQTTK